MADSAAMTKDTRAQTKAANAFLITGSLLLLRTVKTALAQGDSKHMTCESFTYILQWISKQNTYCR
ncbi:Mobile element protein [Geobacillus proteiniphilus]|uniref:Mobile element protein n=1 Tax=Geobacillus proteiniphilus TaxID=860353 RepID=A0A1Q5ST15_9BACL|nr:Mobile element protein [Geobacillus proteiniphilus]